MGNRKSWEFDRQLERGEAGVMIAKMVLRGRYPLVTDYNKDMAMQRRGIDLFAEGLGYIEIKTDYHDDSPNFFLETSVGNRPGAVDTSGAEYFCFIYPNRRQMYLLPRPHIVKWLREHWEEYVQRDKIIPIKSHQGSDTWSANGIVVSREKLIRYVRKAGGKVVRIHWKESEEVLSNLDWGEEV
ncbi:MAG: hypothetical protein PHV11_00300 [Candidatus Bipolaricaulis sp.]|nr:hypothetical protein [Candidatus Bipolaricaulis sp.]